MKIILSACLAGENCKYNGGNNHNEKLMEALRDHQVIKVCPEVMGGLPTPRIPSEITGGRVMNRAGEDVDGNFRLGARLALEKAREAGCDLAVLQPRSPSCGCGQIYDGSFSGVLVPGNGIFADLLKKNGLTCMTPEDFLQLNI